MKERILVADDEQNIRRTMEMIHEGAGYEVHCVESGDAALDFLAACDASDAVDLVYLDIRMPGLDGMEVLARIRDRYPELSVVMISGHASIERAVEALKLGAADFLEKGFTKARLLATTEAALERVRLRRENAQLKARVEGSGEILGKSEVIAALREQIARVAPTSARVLITGESGTGKELVARAIHRSSERAGKPFVKLNCAAVPEELIESELFGVLKGAYTGADRNREGKFAAADGGTLFLDEIGDMSLRTQTKVLRVLQEGEFEKVGSTVSEKVDVRVLAATNKKLEEEVAQGRFREDLYYRLAVVPIQLAPLRARKEDIGELAAAFLAEFSAAGGLAPKRLSPELVARLERHSWPGNIRELRNQIERLLIMSRAPLIGIEDLGPGFDTGSPSRGSATSGELMRDLAAQFLGQPLKSARRKFEAEMLRQALERRHGNVTRAAQDLGLERTNLHKKIRQLEEAGEDFTP